MAEQKQKTSSKGNPASKRMSNAHRKEARAQSWRDGERRKAERVAAQKEREKANRIRRAAGEPTPWEIAKAARKARRAAEGKHAVWVKRTGGATDAPA